MIIASQKRKENIAEYLLYMWQIEDIIRAYKLDIDTIDEQIVSKYNVPDDKKKEIRVEAEKEAKHSDEPLEKIKKRWKKQSVQKS